MTRLTGFARRNRRMRQRMEGEAVFWQMAVVWCAAWCCGGFSEYVRQRREPSHYSTHFHMFTVVVLLALYGFGFFTAKG